MSAVLQSELEVDAVAAATMDALEVEVMEEVDAIRNRIKNLERRAKALRDKLDAVGPGDEETISALAAQISALELEVLRERHSRYRNVAAALGWRYSVHEIEAWCERAVQMGCAHPQFPASVLSDLVRVRAVPNVRLRERAEEVLASGSDTLHEITLRFYEELTKVEGETGVYLGSKNVLHAARGGSEDLAPNPSYVERLLGIASRKGSGPNPSLRWSVPYEQAVALARALNMQPYEAGV